MDADAEGEGASGPKGLLEEDDQALSLSVRDVEKEFQDVLATLVATVV